MSINLNRITLGVASIERATNFYDNWLGVSHDKLSPDCALYKLGNVLLMFKLLKKLADEADVTDESEGFSGVILSREVNSQEELEQVIRSAQDIGGCVTKRASINRNGTYSDYFSDLDGYMWEVISSKDENDTIRK
jgi:predicted lactoylglutathione lyase